MTCHYDRMDNEPRATQMDSAEESSAAGRREARNFSKTQTIQTMM